MPSLLTTTVAANYGRMTGPNYTESGQVRTYDGPYTAFGTRQVKFLSIVLSGGTPPNLLLVDGSTADTGSVKGFTVRNSAYSVAIRTIQQFGEIYMVGKPAASGGLSFTVVVSEDTVNAAQSGNTQAATGGSTSNYGLLEAALLAALVDANNAVWGTPGSGVVTITGRDLDGVTLA